jgi:hypothetical protein
VRTHFESALGADLSALRVHTGTESGQAAESLGTSAFAFGNDIHFGPNAYRPTEAAGIHLIAHEVTHTLQQAGEAPRIQCSGGAPGTSDERQADQVADSLTNDSSPAASDGIRGEQGAPLRLMLPKLHVLPQAEFGLSAAVPRKAPSLRLELRGKLFELENVAKSDYQKLAPHLYDVKSADEYVERVESTFGSLGAYRDWSLISDQLLERPVAPGKKLSSQIERPGDEQKVFFRWVSWKYNQQCGLDPESILRLILARQDPDAQEALARVEQDIGESVDTKNVFNPRPHKEARQKRYVLGTLSEHATGRAIDIDPTNNPFMPGSTWKAIEKAVGINVDRTRKRWIDDPAGLFRDVAALDKAWVSMLHEHEATRRWAQQHHGLLTENLHMDGGEATTAAHDDGAEPGLLDQDLSPPKVPGLGAGMGAQSAGQQARLQRPEMLRTDRFASHIRSILEGVSDAQISALATLPTLHFFNHSEDLVMALRRQGFIWGITFRDVDVHHFELPDPPLPPP